MERLGEVGGSNGRLVWGVEKSERRWEWRK